MKTKICTKCKIEKSLDEFTIDKSCKYGKSPWCKECMKDYRIKNLDKAKEYRKKNKDKAKEYRKSHKTERRLYDKTWCNNKHKTDVNFKLIGNLRRRLRMAIKRNSKTSSTIKLLGCSIEYLKLHLQSQFIEGMTWERFMNGEIHIDHIRPCASFDLSKPEEQAKCFNYLNLQSLWALDNLIKGAKYNE